MYTLDLVARLFQWLNGFPFWLWNMMTNYRINYCIDCTVQLNYCGFLLQQSMSKFTLMKLFQWSRLFPLNKIIYLINFDYSLGKNLFLSIRSFCRNFMSPLALTSPSVLAIIYSNMHRYGLIVRSEAYYQIEPGLKPAYPFELLSFKLSNLINCSF